MATRFLDNHHPFSHEDFLVNKPWLATSRSQNWYNRPEAEGENNTRATVHA
jgi:hypothetical protein